MIKRSLMLLLAVSIGSSLQGIQIKNMTTKPIEVRSTCREFYDDGQLGQFSRIIKINSGSTHKCEGFSEVFINVDSVEYLAGKLLGDTRIVVERNGEGFVQITYMPIQKDGITY